VIISHSHRFIFFAVPKTGTHAVRFALRKHLGENDEEQVQLFKQSRLSYPEIARIGHGHIGWREIAPALGPDIWSDYFKFAFVRNPWDRFVSFCAFMHRRTGFFAADPKAAMRSVLVNPEHQSRVAFRPQHELICDDTGMPQIDYVGRYESFQASFDAVCTRVGLPTMQLERINASTHGQYRSYFDEDLVTRVGEIYERDIAAFGYAF
jgi:hypothetical protein